MAYLYFGQASSKRPTPTSVKQVQRGLLRSSMFEFVWVFVPTRQFIRKFVAIAKPLYRLSEKKGKFLWDKSCEESFEALRETLVEAPMLDYSDLNGKFILDTDCSGFGLPDSGWSGEGS